MKESFFTENGLHIDEHDVRTWYLNGELHREDGPAVEFPDGETFWWVNGYPYTEEEFKQYQRTKQFNENMSKILEE